MDRHARRQKREREERSVGTGGIPAVRGALMALASLGAGGHSEERERDQFPQGLQSGPKIYTDELRLGCYVLKASFLSILQSQ